LIFITVALPSRERRNNFDSSKSVYENIPLHLHPCSNPLRGRRFKIDNTIGCDENNSHPHPTLYDYSCMIILDESGHGRPYLALVKKDRGRAWVAVSISDKARTVAWTIESVYRKAGLNYII